MNQWSPGTLAAAHMVQGVCVSECLYVWIPSPWILWQTRLCEPTLTWPPSFNDPLSHTWDGSSLELLIAHIRYENNVSSYCVMKWLLWF